MFHGFISYSHAADGLLAPALQKGLQSFAKRWYQARALRIFRDDASLSVNANLWKSIEEALDDSQHYILLASPESASSHWVGLEARRWRETKPLSHLLVALTAGELAWDARLGDFDWERTNALPPILKGAFDDEPRFVDLRWARHETDLSLHHPRFREAVADLAAPLHGKPKDALASEEVIQQRRAVRVRRAAAAGLLTLAIAAITMGALALIERATALSAAHTAQSQLLAEQAINTENLPTASLLALAAYRLAPTFDARNAILTIVNNHALGDPLLGHHGPVNAVVFAPDGRTLVSAGYDGTIRPWDVMTHRQLGEPLRSDASSINTVAFSRNGLIIASGGDDSTIRLWSSTTHMQIRRPLVDDSKVETLVFGPHDKTLVSGDFAGTIRVWDVASGRQLAVLDRNGSGITSLAVNSNGRMLAAGRGDGTVRLWDLVTRRPLGLLMTHTNGVESVAFSPDGATLAVATGVVELWDIASRKEEGTLVSGSEGGGGDTVAFSHDGSTIASGGSDGTLGLWDVATEQPVGPPLAVHRQFGGSLTLGAVTGVAFSGNDQILASSSDDGSVQLWQPRSKRQLGAPLTGNTSEVPSVAFSPDGHTLVSGAGDVRFWSVTTHRQLGAALTSNATIIYSVAFSPGGQLVAAGGDDGRVRFWDVATHRQLGMALTVDGGDCSGLARCGIYSVAFDPQGRMLAEGGDDGRIRLIEVATRRLARSPLIGDRSCLNPEASVCTPVPFVSIAFSPDGRTLASGSLEGALRIWNLRTNRSWTLTRPPPGSTAANRIGTAVHLAFNDDGTILAAGSDDGTIRLWSMTSRRQLGAPLRATTYGGVSGLAFNPRSDTLASAGKDRTVRLWDVERGRELGTPLTGHTGAVDSVAFSPDGTVIASGSHDRTIRLWTNYPVNTYISQLCSYILKSQAPTLWRELEPTIPYPHPC